MRNDANPGPVWDDDPPARTGLRLLLLALLAPPVALVVCLWRYHHHDRALLTKAALGWSTAMTLVLVTAVVLFTADAELSQATLQAATAR